MAEVNFDDSENERYVNDELDIISDYFELMTEGGLTEKEFNKHKAHCLRRLKKGKYLSSPNSDVSALKNAHSLLKSGCLTKEEYDIVKKQIEKLTEAEQKSSARSKKNYAKKKHSVKVSKSPEEEETVSDSSDEIDEEDFKQMLSNTGIIILDLINFFLVVILTIFKIIFAILDFITKIFVTFRLFRKL